MSHESDQELPDWRGDEIEVLVASNGTLWIADFVEPATRAEVYEEAYDSVGSPDMDANTMQWLPPLARFLQSLCEELRLSLEEQLAAAQRLGPEGAALVTRLQRQLDGMPEDAESGCEEWLRGMDDADYARDVAPAVARWFREPPDWVMEDDYIPASATAQGAAMRLFEDVFSPDERAELGVDIVEGDHPFSSYCAAVLRRSIDDANRAARRGGHGVRFLAAGD